MHVDVSVSSTSTGHILSDTMMEQNKCISLMLYDNINSIRMHCSEQRFLCWQVNKTTHPGSYQYQP